MSPAAGLNIYGRDDELASLVAFLDAVPDGAGGLLLEGEAGAGKTTLFDAALRAARDRSYRVIQARPTEAEARLSFTAIRDLLDPVFDDLADRLPSPQRQALAVALLRASPSGVPERAGAVEAGFLTCLTDLAMDRPLLVAIDDIQWLDRASRRVLEYAARRQSVTGLALLLTSRKDTETGAPLGPDRSIRGSWLRRIQIGPVSLGALHALLLNRLGAPFPRPALRRIHEASGGNPFFALELARLLGARGRSLEPSEELPIPDDVRELVRRRLHALPRSTRDALLVAAALSEPTVAIVGAASGGDLERAIEARILSIRGDRIRFVHPLFASGIYSDAGPTRRREVHQRLATLVPELEERVRHLALASAGPDEAVAAMLDQAAQSAFDRGAIDAAGELAARALEATPAENVDGLHRRRIVEAECSMKAGDTSRARTIIEAALAVAGPGDQHAEAVFYQARLQMFGVDWRTPGALFREALSETDDPTLQARIHLALAQLLSMTRENVRETVEHARTTVMLAEQIGRDDLLGEALALQAKHEMLLGEAVTEGLMERAIALQPALRHLWVAQWPIDYRAAIREWSDDLAGAHADFEEVCRLAQERGDDASREYTLWRRAHVECLTGAWTEALRHLDDGFAMAVQSGRTEFQAIYLGIRALVEAHLGRVQASRGSAQRAFDLAPPGEAAAARREARRALGFLELSLGRHEEAYRHLGPLLTQTLAAGVGEPGAMRFLADEIESLIGLGRFREAEAHLAWLEERARRLDRRSALAGTERCRGLLLAELGATDEALAALQRALANHAHAPMPFERARTMLALGRVARRGKLKRVAREALDQALAVFEELGASIWVATARTELGRIAGRPPSDGRLTPTERRVAELLAEGRSGKEVAAALFVTPKTIETYASRIYAKLGVHSRSALAKRLADNGLIEGAKV